MALKKWDKAAICLPTVDEAKQLARIIENYDPRLRGCFGVIDGQLFALEKNERDSIQCTYYNGMDLIHAVKQVTVFGANGTILAALTNAPGSFHDSYCLILQGLFRKLEQYPDNLYLATDTAFPANPHIRRKLTENELETLPIAQAEFADHLGSILGTVRCSSEWGNGGMQKCFKILVTKKLPTRRPLFRRFLLGNLNRLGNVRTRCMNINQITNVYT